LTVYLIWYEFSTSTQICYTAVLKQVNDVHLIIIIKMDGILKAYLCRMVIIRMQWISNIL